jgi:hypothetical protein
MPYLSFQNQINYLLQSVLDYSRKYMGRGIRNKKSVLQGKRSTEMK